MNNGLFNPEDKLSERRKWEEEEEEEEAKRIADIEARQLKGEPPVVKYIYKMSWFESKRHHKSHTDMYYLNAEDTKWVFETCPLCNHYRVELIQVLSNSSWYGSASRNTELKNKK